MAFGIDGGLRLDEDAWEVGYLDPRMPSVPPDFVDPFADVATEMRPRREQPPPARFEVHVVEGPDRGAHVVIDDAQPSPMLAGQSPACHLRLTDPQVSRRHLSLVIDRDRLLLRDLESTNGTSVNGLVVLEVALRGGETISLGSTRIEVRTAVGASAATLSSATRFGRVIGGSVAMRRLYPTFERIAASRVPVVIEGETGTGKEILAESIHEEGPRRSGPFVVFDCTATPPTLIESALFGHERGAFTGATRQHRGVFEEAHGGTLLVDEIGDLDLALQAKFLRALERSEIRRLGGRGYVAVDVRVLAATRRDLDREVQEGRFRDDLFYRLAVARVELPPLRRRHGDVALLARHFWSALGSEEPIGEEVLRRLEAHDWPGNVRELNNAVARLIALGAPAEGSSTGNARDDRDVIDRILAEDLPLGTARQRMIDHFEQRYLERVLMKHGGDTAKAAAAAGIARRYFQLLRARHAP